MNEQLFESLQKWRLHEPQKYAIEAQHSPQARQRLCKKLKSRSRLFSKSSGGVIVNFPRTDCRTTLGKALMVEYT